MENHLILFRVIGTLTGLFFLLLGFLRFREHLIRRHEFLIFSLFGVALTTVSIFPDSVNILVGMFSLENKQFGRLITLLIFSNLLLWVLVFGLRNKDSVRSISIDLLIRHLGKSQFSANYENNVVKEIAVIIPALNEARNLEKVLPLIPQEIQGHSSGALVVDDGSSDDTVAVTRLSGYPVVSNPMKRGGGAALRLGYDIAVQGNAKILVTMDADGQHLPEEIEGLVAPIINDSADVVIGSRILGKYEQDSRLRLLGVHIFSFMINFIAGTRITDCSNGFRAFRVDAMKKVLLLQDQFHTAELIIDAAKKGLRIGEAPVT
ncbi:MAG: glycosyltransferase family 2 protein, partial [Nitrospinota bacterium]